MSGLPEEIVDAIRHLTSVCMVAPGFNDAVIANRNIRNGVEALTATILARLTAAESAREAAVGERDAFREKLAEMFGQLMLAEGSASKLRAEREHTDLRIRAQRARLRELEPRVGGAVATDGRVRLLQFARKKAAECRALRRENTTLRTIVSESATAIGNGAGIGIECSLEFMSWLPKEIAGVTSKLRAEIRDQTMKQFASDAGWELDWNKVRAEKDAALARAERAEVALEPLWQRARAPGADRVPDDATVTVFMKDCREALAAIDHPATAEET